MHKCTSCIFIVGTHEGECVHKYGTSSQYLVLLYVFSTGRNWVNPRFSDQLHPSIFNTHLSVKRSCKQRKPTPMKGDHANSLLKAAKHIPTQIGECLTVSQECWPLHHGAVHNLTLCGKNTNIVNHYQKTLIFLKYCLSNFFSVHPGVTSSYCPLVFRWASFTSLCLFCLSPIFL